MRFNQKELAFIATRTDIPFDKEGILWLKEKEGHFWQRNEGNSLPDDCEVQCYLQINQDSENIYNLSNRQMANSLKRNVF